MAHHSLKIKLIVSFLLTLCYAFSNPYAANSTLAVPFPETNYDSQDSSGIEPFSEPGSSDDYYNFPKKPSSGQGSFRSLQNVLWLIPVLRYVITVNGDSVRMETNPVTSLLPVVLRIAANWWFHEQQMLDLLSVNNESIIGDPIVLMAESVDGIDGEPVKTSDQNEQKGGRKLPRRKRKRNLYGSNDHNENLDEGEPPPEKSFKESKSEEYENSLTERLHYAVKNQDERMVKTLLKAGANPNISWQEEYPIFLAAHPRYSHAKICEQLLLYDANPNMLDPKNKWTPLLRLLVFTRDHEDAARNEETIRILLRYGADYYLKWKNKNIAFWLLMKYWDDYPEIRESLFDQLNTHAITTLETLDEVERTCFSEILLSPHLFTESGIMFFIEQSIKHWRDRKKPCTLLLKLTIKASCDPNYTELLCRFMSIGRACINANDLVAVLFKLFHMEYDNNLKDKPTESIVKISHLIIDEIKQRRLNGSTLAVDGVPLVLSMILRNNKYSVENIEWLFELGEQPQIANLSWLELEKRIIEYDDPPKKPNPSYWNRGENIRRLVIIGYLPHLIKHKKRIRFFNYVDHKFFEAIVDALKNQKPLQFFCYNKIFEGLESTEDLKYLELRDNLFFRTYLPLLNEFWFKKLQIEQRCLCSMCRPDLNYYCEFFDY